MPLTFPSSPAVNQTSTQNGRVYRWSGLAWEFDSFTTAADDARWSLFLPPAPTGVTATAGNAQATVSWTAPSVLSQTPVTDYVVQYSSNSGSTWTTFSDGTSTSTSATVTGLTNGTAYTFRVAGTNGVGTGAYSTASSAVTPAAGDPFFGNVSLLLHMDGSGNTFVDSSAYGRAVTANGSVTQSTAQSKFGGKSAYFDGSGDYLTFGGADLSLGSGDFALEMWVYFNSVQEAQLWEGRDTGGGPSNAPALNVYGGSIYWFANGANQINGGAVSTAQWYHIAVSRASGSTRMFIDGVQVGATYSDSTNYTNASGSPKVGIYHPTNNWGAFSGYIDEIRLTVGSSRGYTGSTITVPTAPFPDA